MAVSEEQVEEALIAVAKKVRKRFDREYQQLLATDPQRAAEYYLSLTPKLLAEAKKRQIIPGEQPRPTMKYLNPKAVRRFRDFIPFMRHHRRIFEIGVGPGFLMRILRDAHGVDIRGCDVDPNENIIFRELREELGITDLVVEHAVSARQEIPIPDQTEAVVGFWTMFNYTWTVAEHEWFLDFCRDRLVGEKKVILLFNAIGWDDNPDVRRFYHSRGEFPLRRSTDPVDQYTNEKSFCVVRLA